MGGARARRAALLVVLALCACPGQSAADGPGKKKEEPDPTAQDYPAPPLRKGHVLLESSFGGQAAVAVEIAETPEAIQRGMMWRRELAAGKGMLFVFDRASHHSFWMKNCFIALDMIFIGSDLTVQGVVENAQPGTLTGRSVSRPSQYVLEVPAGWAARTGVREGTRVKLDLPAAAPERR